MVEISLSGSGEGPGWETFRPTLQRYFATAPSGMHPLGGVGTGQSPGRTELRVTGSGPAQAGSGGAGEPQREAAVRDCSNAAIFYGVGSYWRN